MDIFKVYATDEVKEKSGTWKTLSGKAKILIARSGNREYARLFSKLVEQNAEALATKDDAADAVADEIVIEVVAKTVLLGWENLEYDGAPIEYSYENAKKLLSIKDFRKVVMKHADDIENFLLAREAEQGNA